MFSDREINAELVKGDNGAFEVYCQDRLVFSKFKEDRFPAYQEIPQLIIESLSDDT